MSYPTEIDAAIIYRVTGGTRAAICGIENVTVGESANTTDRFRFDCAKPGAVSTRTIHVNSTQWSVTGSGVANADELTALKAVFGKHQAYEVDAIEYDGTDTGNVLGTFAGQAVLTTKNLNLQRTADSTMDITIEGEGDLTWTAA